MFSSKKKLRLLLIGIIILTVLTAFLDFPQFYDKGVDWINKTINLGLPHFYNRPFKLGLDLQGGTHLIYEADMKNIPAADRSSAIEGIRDVIERRVNTFGISEPNVQTSHSGDRWMLVVELAGVKDVNEAIKMIGETPLLEFKEQGEISTSTPTITADEQKQLDDNNKEAEIKAQDILKQALKPNADFLALAKQYSEDPSAQKNSGELGFVARGKLVPEFETICFDKLKIGETSKELVKTSYGYHIIKKVDQKGGSQPDGTDNTEANCQHILILTKTIYDLKPELLQPEWKYTGLTGKQLKKSQVTFDPNTGSPEVSLEFDDEGQKLFADITKKNVGKMVAIFLDNQPISIPRVNEPILTGNAVISGNFSLPEAKVLAQRLNAGALPVPINLISQETIGATLGKEALQKSLLVCIIGMILVVIFMIVYYRLPGLMANFALLVYGFVLLAIFKLIPVTLTLAGIAGFILSLGMAVDGNILVFERLKEELKSKNPLKKSINEAFRRAWPSIRDGNYSTVMTCLILMWFSTSIVKGFAITLTIGIFVNIFSAMLVTRVFMEIISSDKMGKYPWLWGLSNKSPNNSDKK